MSDIIRLAAGDNHKLDAYRADPAGSPKGAIVVIQEIFGINRHIREVCDGYAAEGYATIAPALFDRVEKGVELAYNQEGIARGIELKNAIGWDAAMQDVGAAAAAVKGAGKVGVVGYCWGGTVAWLAGCRLDQVAAAVGYYGGGIAAFNNENPKGPAMLHFGELDHSIPLDDVEKIRAAHPDVTIHTYAGAQHGFNCDHRPQYSAADAAEARRRTLDFFAANLADTDQR